MTKSSAKKKPTTKAKKTVTKKTTAKRTVAPPPKPAAFNGIKGLPPMPALPESVQTDVTERVKVATGKDLDLLAGVHGLERLAGESDESVRRRITNSGTRVDAGPAVPKREAAADDHGAEEENPQRKPANDGGRLAGKGRLATVTPIAPKIEKTPQRARRQIDYSPKDIAKVTKKLDPVATSTLEEMEQPALMKMLADLGVHEEETEMFKANDPDLKEAKASVSELGAPYRETLAGIKARRRYIVSMMQTRGYNF